MPRPSGRGATARPSAAFRSRDRRLV